MISQCQTILFLSRTPRIHLQHYLCTLIDGDDHKEISNLKAHLHKNFKMKDLGHLRYFLGIQVERTSEGFHLNQRKYVLELLKET